MTNTVSTVPEAIPEKLIAAVAAQSTRSISSDFPILAEALLERYGTSADGVILYGSCLRTSDLDEGIADLYVLVDDYKNAYTRRHLSLLNAWLAPNVFYLEVSHQDRTLRAKYAVITTAEFEKGAQYWFHSYIWARFAQPSRLLYARDEKNRQRIFNAIAHSVITFLSSGGKTLENNAFTVADIWTRCLMLSYAAELRAEQETRARHLATLNLNDFTQLTETAYPVLTEVFNYQPESGTYLCRNTAATRRLALQHWRLRRWQGRILSVLRLSKATLTFSGYLEYAAWKIERHTGVSVEITPVLRRHPVIWGLKVMWQLLRRGIIR
ncbi:hypothetical protein [Nitrosomonas aestuarii]|uniref:hypothetical protein n=1 Tax=Nitrosomonas aestuarii TaxID=52441 RepID=UPI000D46CCEB|nr:hypothetical protein [Nitrosomonas aestuarii]PTN12307.1 hypothetical protein C8R11_10491 [Nitrosomonas aestuarii]